MQHKIQLIPLDRRWNKKPPEKQGLLDVLNAVATKATHKTGLSRRAHHILARKSSVCDSKAGKDALYTLRQQVAQGGIKGLIRSTQIILRLV